MAQNLTHRSLVDLYTHKVTPIEVLLMQHFFQLRRVIGMTPMFRLASRLGDWPLWVLIGLVLLTKGREPEYYAVLLAVLSSAISIVIFKLLKNLTGRPRPFESYQGLTALMAPPDKFSFPSGHTMTAFAIWSSFLIQLPWLAPWVLPAAIVIGLSRVFLGLHYPTDVLMGALLGSAVGLGATYSAYHYFL